MAPWEGIMGTTSRRTFIAACCALSLLPGEASAQATALRIIYPFPAGGAADAVARLLAEQLQTSLGRAAIVENRTGAGGRIGVKSVVQAEADGGTLLFVPGPLVALHPHIFQNLGYDPLTDLRPISQVMQSDLALAAATSVPAKTLSELITWLRSNPAHATYGSLGVGGVAHLTVAEWARLSKLDLRHVSYRGTPAALPDLLAGRLPLYAAATPELIEQHKAGGIRIVATTGAVRSPLLPDVPTFKQQGFNIVAPMIWFGVYAPAKTPSDVAKRLNDAIVAAVNAPEVQARIRATGYQPTGTNGEALHQVQKADFDFWGPIVKASGITPEQH
jgi:tripartite-type tricarboxylate transporter receptor subunit TctC